MVMVVTADVVVGVVVVGVMGPVGIVVGDGVVGAVVIAEGVVVFPVISSSLARTFFGFTGAAVAVGVAEVVVAVVDGVAGVMEGTGAGAGAVVLGVVVLGVFVLAVVVVVADDGHAVVVGVMEGTGVGAGAVVLGVVVLAVVVVAADGVVCGAGIGAVDREALEGVASGPRSQGTATPPRCRGVATCSMFTSLSPLLSLGSSVTMNSAPGSTRISFSGYSAKSVMSLPFVTVKINRTLSLLLSRILSAFAKNSALSRTVLVLLKDKKGTLAPFL
jgi:hypothetical protein